jgi:glycerophosphoryl diester phosphodiesterase
MAKTVMRVLKREKFLDRAILVSFDWPALIAAKKIEPSAQCWFTTLPFAEMERAGTAWTGGFEPARYGSVVKAAKAAGADGWFPYYADINRATLTETRELGLQLGAWTVNEPDDLARLADLGVDGLCTDYPDRLSTVLKGM